MAYSTITKPGDYFNTLLYTATGVQSVTGAGFQPDMSWVKARSTTSSHYIADAVRGSTKTIKPNATDAEGTIDLITSFDSDGVTLGSANWSDSRTAVIWNWLGANASSSNTDGSITSTVSANTTSGFSIVSYTGNGTAGATVGHGLNQAPEFVLTKARNDGVSSWGGYHVGTDLTAPEDYVVQIDSSGARIDAVGMFNDTAPTSSVCTLGSATYSNHSSNPMIMYCFHSVKGYSKFGSYTGNGNVDGTFVYLGFKPAMVILKRTDGGVANWQLNDSARDTFNVVNKRLAPNASDAEATNFNFGDFLSNGFKIRQTDQTWNISGGNYIYMAFAENPLVANTGGGIPATAR
jgi:hypothetical protein